MADWSETYPAVSSAFDPAYRLLPQAEVEQVIRGVFGESADLATAEGFFDDVGKAFYFLTRVPPGLFRPLEPEGTAGLGREMPVNNLPQMGVERFLSNFWIESGHGFEKFTNSES